MGSQGSIEMTTARGRVAHKGPPGFSEHVYFAWAQWAQAIKDLTLHLTGKGAWCVDSHTDCVGSFSVSPNYEYIPQQWGFSFFVLSEMLGHSAAWALSKWIVPPEKLTVQGSDNPMHAKALLIMGPKGAREEVSCVELCTWALAAVLHGFKSSFCRFCASFFFF